MTIDKLKNTLATAFLLDWEYEEYTMTVISGCLVILPIEIQMNTQYRAVLSSYPSRILAIFHPVRAYNPIR